MQTYGFTVGQFDASGKYLIFYWPLLGPDKKTAVPTNIANPYVDSMSRVGPVFCRIRTVAESQRTVSPQGYIIVMQGGYVIRSGYNITRREKDCDYVIESAIARVEGSYKFCLTVTEYKPSVVTLEGTRLVYTVQRTSSSGWIGLGLGPVPPFSEAYLNSLKEKHFPSVLRSLGSKSFAPIGNGYSTLSAAFETGQRVMGNLSQYAGIARSHFESLVTLGKPCDQRSCSAAQMAYVKAAEGLPSVTSNGMANTIELASLFAALLRRDISSSAKHLSDAWLAYRYAYTTTLLDVREYSSYVNRILSLSQPDVREIHTHGYVTDDGWTFHVVLSVNAGNVLPSDVASTLSSFGVELTAVNAWDLVPYSFIVDWFIPVADSLDQWESHWKSRDLQVQSAWLSITSPTGDCYVRAPISWNSAAPFLVANRVKTKTIFMRIADAISLLAH